jgi:FkbM family methyltransferase
MINRVKVVSGKKTLKFDLTYTEKEWILKEVVYSESYFPKINRELDFKIGQNDTVIDIGGNVGIFSIFAASLARSGKVYSFEPVKENFERLKHNKELNGSKNITLENKGVSDKRKKAKIYLIKKNTGGHSMEKNKFKYLRENIRGTETIECIPLKDIFDKYNLSKCDFLKIDCEGEEFKILSKLPHQYFRRIDKIALEFHRPVVDPLRLGKYLTKQGFTVIITNPWPTPGNVLGMIFAKRKAER